MEIIVVTLSLTMSELKVVYDGLHLFIKQDGDVMEDTTARAMVRYIQERFYDADGKGV